MDYDHISHDYKKDETGFFFCSHCGKMQEPHVPYDVLTCPKNYIEGETH